LLDLPASVQQYLREARLSTGHAKVLLGLKKAEDMEASAEMVLVLFHAVRATEKLVDSILRPPAPKPEPVDQTSEMKIALKAIEQKLTRHFSTAVFVHHGEKKGRLEIEYYGVDDLNRLLSSMGLEDS